MSKPTYPVLPLRDIVVFPNMIVPLFVGRERSVRAVGQAIEQDKQVFLVSQKTSSQEEPTPLDIYEFGTIGSVLQLLKLPDGTVKVLVEGASRAKALKINYDDKLWTAELDLIAEPAEPSDNVPLTALRRTVIAQFEQYLKLNKKIPPDVLSSVSQIQSAGRLADTIAAHLSLKISDKQHLLETIDLNKRLEAVCHFIEGEIGLLQAEQNIRNQVKKQMEKTQRDYYLNEQMKAIQKELGEGEDTKDDFKEIQDKINKLKLPVETREKANAELKKLRAMSPMSAEASVVRNYLDWLLALPWQTPSKIKRSLPYAEKVLNNDHYGLDKVKERILEYLAVQNRIGKVKGAILCLVGPPGVGKTSLGKSIAKATGRSFVRVSLGGVRDEAEIRGHRRTYIGAMPGKIIQGMRKAKSSNPLFLLDEIDKLGSDWRGDPSSALLEVLDPEQNVTYNDHYLEVDYDLSDVMFVTTANTLDMPQPLLDRMEIIRLSGYTEDEKTQIALRYLLKKQMDAHGLKRSEFSISEDAIRAIIANYTREAGVRNLERELASLARKAIREIVGKKRAKVVITRRNLEKYLGIPRYKYSEAETENLIGVTTGLAWTEVGGELLSIEAVAVPGKGKIMITGKLGDVMQESVQAAASYVRSRHQEFNIDPNTFEKMDVHVHVPEGATPKDGPSAGIAMCTSIVSALTGNPIHKDVAMTGEITLRGRVLAIGGLKEKLLAAHRAKMRLVLIPEENEKDLAEIPENVKKELEVKLVSTVDEVLAHALVDSSLLPANIVQAKKQHVGRSSVGTKAGTRTKKKASLVSKEV